MLNDWNFADVWECVAQTRGDAPAIQQGPRSISWSDFDARSSAVASWLTEVVRGRQAKVAQYLYNCPEYLESVYASFKAALVPVNTNYRYVGGELVYLWNNADVEVVVFHATFAERIEGIRDQLDGVRAWVCVADEADIPDWSVAYEDVVAIGHGASPLGTSGRSTNDLLLLYTGGTTGYPKGVMWRQGELFELLNRPGEYQYPIDGALSDVQRVLTASKKHGPPKLTPCAPLMHANSLFSASTTLTAGGTVVLLESRSFDPVELLDTIAGESITEISLVGDVFAQPLVRALEEDPGRWDISSLWLIISGGVMWSADTKQRLLNASSKLLLLDTLGSSETVSVASSRSSKDGIASTGRFRLGRGAMVIDEHGHPIVPGSADVGLLVLRGAGPVGYYKDEAKTAQTFRMIDGVRWAITGDYATVDDDGYVELLGRGSGCINTGGEKVFPEEVEEVLKRHAAVADAAVVGVPDDRFGEVVTAVVEPLDKMVVQPDELIVHAKRSLAGFKVPRHVLVVDSIGRGPNGKVDYQRLREIAAASLETTA